ncbi:MAG TPA: HAD family hydrolase [Acidimicrobiia bacterium]|nr:HAD family hydrolase [Acidimicrobiia bacterium]
MHLVWDWNGILFDDLHVVVEAVNVGLAGVGVQQIDLDQYRTHYTRPVKVFYDRLLGRSVEEHEWLRLDRVFHDAYIALLDQAQLTVDAAEALTLVKSGGHTQSLLSMFPHQQLLPLVDRLGVGGFFDRIDGLRGAPGDVKAVYLEEHLRELIGDEDPRRVGVIGDTPDDAVAAVHVGAHCVLYDGGSHHRRHLEEMGVPVAATLMEAVDLAFSLDNGPGG